MTLPPTARAAVLVAPRQPLQLREYPLSPAPAGGAIVRTHCCTICRSDLHTWKGQRPGPIPAILGHEIVGQIAALGEGLTHDARDQPLMIGDRVTWTLHSSCGRCRYCVDWQLPMKCRSLRKYGHDACDQPPHLQGGFAEYCIIDAGTKVLKLPDSLPDAVAAPANCATATIVAGWEAARIHAGESVLIQGAGALGCYAAAFAAHAGCRPVIVSDIDARRLDMVRRFGATNVIDASQVGPAESIAHIKQLTDGFGVDCALEVAGVPSLVEIGISVLRKGGRYIEIGCSYPEARVSLDMSTVLWNLLTIRGVHNYDVRHLSGAVDFLDSTRDRFPWEQVVGATFNLEQINAALNVAESGAALRVAVIFDAEQ